MPARLPSGPDNKRRIMPGEMSLFYQLQNNQFATTIDFWARLYTGKHSGAIPKSELQNILMQANTAPFSEPLKRLNTIVLNEFTGRLPIAASKYRAIYGICLQILNEMAFLALQAQDQPVEHASPTMGLTFVETLLVVIVEHSAGSSEGENTTASCFSSISSPGHTEVLRGENAGGVRVDVLSTVGQMMELRISDDSFLKTCISLRMGFNGMHESWKH